MSRELRARAPAEAYPTVWDAESTPPTPEPGTAAADAYSAFVDLTEQELPADPTPDAD